MAFPPVKPPLLASSQALCWLTLSSSLTHLSSLFPLTAFVDLSACSCSSNGEKTGGNKPAPPLLFLPAFCLQQCSVNTLPPSIIPTHSQSCTWRYIGVFLPPSPSYTWKRCPLELCHRGATKGSHDTTYQEANLKGPQSEDTRGGIHTGWRNQETVAMERTWWVDWYMRMGTWVRIVNKEEAYYQANGSFLRIKPYRNPSVQSLWAVLVDTGHGELGWLACLGGQGKNRKRPLRGSPWPI